MHVAADLHCQFCSGFGLLLSLLSLTQDSEFQVIPTCLLDYLPDYIYLTTYLTTCMPPYLTTYMPPYLPTLSVPT